MLRPSKEERIKFDVDYAPDSDFSAYARMLQSKWRVSKNYPFNKYGNFLPSDFAIKSKANFITSKIKLLAGI
jgi:hypothetical protein